MKNIFKAFTALCFIVMLIIFPETVTNASKSALDTCLTVLFPSLFPFFVLSDIFIKSGGADILGKMFSFIMRPLFRINGNGVSAFLLGIISGYPIGAKTAVGLYENGYVTKKEAENLICFCNNSGALFIIGALGSGMIGNSKAGFFLYAVHILSAITLGIILRISLPVTKHPVAHNTKSAAHSNIFTSAVENGMSSVIRVFAYVIFFAVMLEVAEAAKIFSFFENRLTYSGINKNLSVPIIRSVFEMTAGIKKLSVSDVTLSLKLIIFSFMLGWSGLSVIFQTKSVIDKINIRFSKYILAKLHHGLIASVYAYAGLKIITFNNPAFFSIGSPIITNAFPRFFTAITYIVCIIYIILQVRSVYKRPDSVQKQTTAR